MAVNTELKAHIDNDIFRFCFRKTNVFLKSGKSYQRVRRLVMRLFRQAAHGIVRGSSSASLAGAPPSSTSMIRRVISFTSLDAIAKEVPQTQDFDNIGCLRCMYYSIARVFGSISSVRHHLCARHLRCHQGCHGSRCSRRWCCCGCWCVRLVCGQAPDVRFAHLTAFHRIPWGYYGGMVREQHRARP